MTSHYHAVQFYKDAQSLASTVARFLADGLNAGEPVIVVAAGPHAAAITCLRDLWYRVCRQHSHVVPS